MARDKCRLKVRLAEQGSRLCKCICVAEPECQTQHIVEQFLPDVDVVVISAVVGLVVVVVSVVESSTEAVVASTVVDFSVVSSLNLVKGLPWPIFLTGTESVGTGPETNRLRVFHGSETEALRQFVTKTVRSVHWDDPRYTLFLISDGPSLHYFHSF